VNVAVTDLAALIVTIQLPVPVHAPLQPVNVDVPSGAAVKVTTVPLSNNAEQVAPQSIPAGDEVTEPPPVPAFVRVRVKAGRSYNSAEERYVPNKDALSPPAASTFPVGRRVAV
jgi:hypothetical protein